MLLHAFRAFRESGTKKVVLMVSSLNVSSARRLYDSLGMKEVLRIDHYKKALQPASPKAGA